MQHGTTAVLVAERDGECGGWLKRLRSSASAIRVIAQRPDESATAFAARVRAQVQRLERVDAAVLVGGTPCDPEVLAARALVVRALTSRMPAAGRLHLDGSGRARLAMQALAQIVCDQLAASGVEVVTEHAPVSGPRPALPLAA